jgi:hypothetical protein
MTQPVGGYCRSPYDYATTQDPAATTNPALKFCQHASTVTEGFLCDEPTVVSNACRSPTNDGDRFVCDDKNLAGGPAQPVGRDEGHGEDGSLGNRGADAMSPGDPRWVWLVYATVFVPLIGQPIVVFGSSVLYFKWRRHWPKAASRLNRHAWIAVALNVLLTLTALRLVGR